MVNVRQEEPGHRALARNTDAQTSQDAAQQLTGRRGLVDRIVAFVEANPGKVRGEIAGGLNEPQERVWRRLSDVVRWGKVLYGAPRLYDGRKQQTVWPKEYQSKAFFSLVKAATGQAKNDARGSHWSCWRCHLGKPVVALDNTSLCFNCFANWFEGDDARAATFLHKNLDANQCADLLKVRKVEFDERVEYWREI